MSTFIVSLQTLTPVVIGQWLTLDAVLDGVLEIEGLEPHERILPLLSWDGTSKHEGLSTAEVRERSLIHLASAMRVGGKSITVDNVTRLDTTRPRVMNVSFRGGENPRFFTDDVLPFLADSGRFTAKFEVKRNVSAHTLTPRRCLTPCRVEWLAQGDPDAVVDILGRAMGIGAKITSGMGRFDPDSLHVDVLTDASDLSGVLDEGGEFVHRPVPQSMGAGNARSRLAMQTCRSPYWDRSLAESARIPLSRHHDGLLTL